MNELSQNSGRIYKSKNLKVRDINPLSSTLRQFTLESKVRVPVPLVAAEVIAYDENGVATNKNEEMDALWIKRVVAPVKEGVKYGFGLGPVSLMMTSVFGPFNSRKDDANDLLIAEFDNTRIFYSGKLMGPDHLLMFMTLLNIYIKAPEVKRTKTNCVTIDMYALVLALYGDGKLRSDSKGGRSTHFDKKIGDLFKDLKSSAITVIEGGDKKGTIGLGKGYIANLLREFSWDEGRNTFTFAIDYRVANLYALNGHSFVLLSERHRYKLNQSEADTATFAIQNLFKVYARESKSVPNGIAPFKEVSFSLGDLMIRLGGLDLPKKVFIDRIISASLKFNPTLITCTEISGLSLDDTISMSDCEISCEYNILGLSFEDAKKLIEARKQELTTKRKGRDQRYIQELAEYGVSVGPFIKRSSPALISSTVESETPATLKNIVDSKPAESDINTPPQVLQSATPDAALVAKERVTPATDIPRTIIKRKNRRDIKAILYANGLRGKLSSVDDKPACYIMLRDFVPGFPGFESIADHNGAYPIYESWIAEWNASPAAIQAKIEPNFVRHNIESACIWSELRINQRKPVPYLASFLTNWICQALDKRNGVQKGDMARRPTAQEKSVKIRRGLDAFLAGENRTNEKQINPSTSETGFSGQIFDNE